MEIHFQAFKMNIFKLKECLEHQKEREENATSSHTRIKFKNTMQNHGNN